MVRNRRYVLHLTASEDDRLRAWSAQYEREPAQMLRWLLRSVFAGEPASELEQLAHPRPLESVAA